MTYQIIFKKINKWPWKKIGQYTANILVGLAVFVAALAIFTRFNLPGNYRFFTVQSGSMSPVIYTGSVVLVQPSTDYKIGDIITFQDSRDISQTITHRLTEVNQQDGETFYRVKGDANPSPDSELVASRYVLGKVILAMPLLGYVVSFAKSALGLILLIIIPATIIIYEEIKKIKKEWIKLQIEKKKKQNTTAENANVMTEQKNISTKEKFMAVLTKHRKIFILAIFFTANLLFFNQAQAITKTIGDLTITYPDEPLFNETNLAPGYITSKIITVTNNASEEKNIGIIFTSGAVAELDDVLNFSIQKNGITIYGGPAEPKTLSDLISAGEISLTTLPAGQSADFTLTAELNTSIGNDYQNKTSIFDLSVGFVETETPPPANVNIPVNLNQNTNNTNGLVLGEEITNEEPAKSKILGLELPITGDQLITYSLFVVTFILLTISTIFTLKNRCRIVKKR